MLAIVAHRMTWTNAGLVAAGLAGQHRGRG
jgi:hypothetical protein